MKRIVALVVSILTLLALWASTASASNLFPSIPAGSAYAGYAAPPSGSHTSTVGPIAPSSAGCVGAPGTASNSTNSISLPFLESGIAQDVVTISRTATSGTAQAISTIQNVNVLQGLIRASQVRAVATSTATANGAASNSAGSSLSGLQIAGAHILASPGPNTTIQLPGFGFVALNEQSGSNGPASTFLSINMIDVHITMANNLGIPVGSRIVIGHAGSSNLDTAAPVLLGGRAFGFSASGLAGPSSTRSGPFFEAGIGCQGGSAQSSGAAESVPSAESTTGTATSSASGQIGSTVSKVLTQVNLSNLNLLRGLIQAGHLTVVNQLVLTRTVSRTASTTLNNAMVNGKPEDNNPAPNEVITIPGVGYVVLNEQIESANSSNTSQYVIAIDVHITIANSYGLPVGARIVVGFTHANIVNY